jgi:hypothetical protein
MARQTVSYDIVAFLRTYGRVKHIARDPAGQKRNYPGPGDIANPLRLRPHVDNNASLGRPMMSKSIEVKAYQLKVTLRGTRPPIWRRLEVRGDTTLGRLHNILQVAMRWTNSHMHQFTARGTSYGQAGRDLQLEREDEDKCRLDQLLKKPRDRMVYEYDFGDGWTHDIVVEKLVPAIPGRRRYPAVTAGRRACPPEDCGGIWGHCHLLEVLENPAHPAYEELAQCCGLDFQPGKFDAGEINRAFHGAWSPTDPNAP